MLRNFFIFLYCDDNCACMIKKRQPLFLYHKDLDIHSIDFLLMIIGSDVRIRCRTFLHVPKRTNLFAIIICCFIQLYAQIIFNS